MNKLACLMTAIGALLLPGHLSAAQNASDDKPMIVIVVGAPGSEAYGKQFETWAKRWQAGGDQGKMAIRLIGLEKRKTSDRQQLQNTIASATKGSAPLWIVLIGHGTFDGRQAKFNLRGPDISAKELEQHLKPVKRPVALINCTASSAPFIPICSRANRVVVTATKSGFEDNLAKFGDHLSAAIADPKADLNGDEQVSLFEAFLTASDRLTRAYEADGQLATEHPLLDDNGDGKGTRSEAHSGKDLKSKSPNATLDGRYADRWHLVPSRFERMLSPAQRGNRDRLETELDKLRHKKQDLEEADYRRRLEALLIKISHLYDAAEAAAPTTPDRP
jgi:hypothetical protein